MTIKRDRGQTIHTYVVHVFECLWIRYRYIRISSYLIVKRKLIVVSYNTLIIYLLPFMPTQRLQSWQRRMPLSCKIERKVVGVTNDFATLFIYWVKLFLPMKAIWSCRWHFLIRMTIQANQDQSTALGLRKKRKMQMLKSKLQSYSCHLLFEGQCRRHPWW